MEPTPSTGLQKLALVGDDFIEIMMPFDDGAARRHVNVEK